MSLGNNYHIILFDGECNWCSFWVKFVIKRDKKDLFRFASLQSEIGRIIIKKYKINSHIDSVILIENKQASIKSTAALRILKMLGGFPSLFYAFIIVPKFLRDGVYDLITKYRYKIFGTSTCTLPTDDHYKNKFI